MDGGFLLTRNIVQKKKKRNQSNPLHKILLYYEKFKNTLVVSIVNGQKRSAFDISGHPVIRGDLNFCRITKINEQVIRRMTSFYVLSINILNMDDLNF